MKNKTSIIWDVPKEKLQQWVDESQTIRELLAKFGFTHYGNTKTLYERCKYDNIDLYPLRTRSKKYQQSLIDKKQFNKKYTIEEVLVENSLYDRKHLKNWLIKDGLLKNKCEKCGLEMFWQGEPLVLVLDHINGISNDNRLENLRLLCPNCNSQTPTFAGKKRQRFCECGNPITRYSKTGKCSSCALEYARERKSLLSKCPSKNILIELKEKMSREAIGRKFGVSGNAVKKWEKKLGII